MHAERKRAWTVAAVICIYAAAYSSYIYVLYSPGLILWQPDFLAFMSDIPSRFYPGGYWVLANALGGGVAAGRMLTAFGLALVMCIVAGAALRNTRYAIPISAWTIATLFAAPSVFSNTLSPSVDMLYTALALSLLAACFIIAEDGAHQRKRLVLQLLLIDFLSQWLMGLRYHAPVLLFAAALALIPSWNRRVAVNASILLVVLSALIMNFNRFASYSATAKEQVWCGLEFRYHRLAERGVLDGLPRGGDLNGYVWDEYAKLKDVAASSRYHDYYSPAELLKHGAANYYHYMRRPLVLLGIAASFTALLLGIRRKQALCALIFLALYTLPLSAAYYTLRASLLTELAGLAAATYFAGEVMLSFQARKRNLALLACSLAVLAVLATSSIRLRSEIGEWHSQLAEASAVDKAVRKTDATSPGIWTEDTGITIRQRGEPIADTPHAFNSWLTYAESAVPPREMASGKGGSYRVLLIRTPELAQEMAESGAWEVEVVRSKTKELYILTRKGNGLIPISSKQ